MLLRDRSRSGIARRAVLFAVLSTGIIWSSVFVSFNYFPGIVIVAVGLERGALEVRIRDRQVGTLPGFEFYPVWEELRYLRLKPSVYSNDWNTAYVVPLWPLLLAQYFRTLRCIRMARQFGSAPAYSCAHCAYDLTGNISGACPECGRAVTDRPDGRALDGGVAVGRAAAIGAGVSLTAAIGASATFGAHDFATWLLAVELLAVVVTSVLICSSIRRLFRRGRVLVAACMFAAAVTTMVTQWPLRIRFALARAEFEDRRLNHRRDLGWAGTFRIRDAIHKEDDEADFFVGSTFSDEWVFSYTTTPSRNDAAYGGGWYLEHY